MPIRLFYILFIGNISPPGFLAYWMAMIRFKKPIRETQILLGSLGAKLKGWWDRKTQKDLGPRKIFDNKKKHNLESLKK